MTPLDQTLVDQMKTALSKSAPDVAKHLPSGPGPMVNLGDSVYASLQFGKLTLWWHGESVELDEKQLRNFEQFLVQIGWRCS